MITLVLAYIILSGELDAPDVNTKQECDNIFLQPTAHSGINFSLKELRTTITVAPGIVGAW